MDAQQRPLSQAARQLVVAGCLAVVLTSPACMLGPNDGETVTSTTAAMTFDGYHPVASKTIEVQSFDPALGAYRTIATTVSSSSAFRYDGMDLYPWSVTAVIPHWQAGAAGQVARVRARDTDGNSFSTFRPDWMSCLSANPAVTDFVSHCASPHSPELFLYTAGFPTSADLVLTSIRLGGRGLFVRVYNQGRHGKVTRIECFHQGGSMSGSFDQVMLPAEIRELELGLTAGGGQTVTCTVSGVNEDGTPEAATGNNTRSQAVF